MKILSVFTPQHRTEKDSLGAIEVPKNALWGAQTARALKNFQIAGRLIDPILIRSYLFIKEAAAQTNQLCGVLSQEKSELICRSARDLRNMTESQWADIFPLDIYQAGAGTNLNMNVNEVLANYSNSLVGQTLGSYSPIHPNDDVNHSQSTNDTFPTAMRIALLEASRPMIAALQSLAYSFKNKGQDWLSIPKAARTHLQDAVPMRLGEEMIAYSQAIQRCTDWLSNARENLRELGIGGSAAGTGLNVPKDYIQKLIPILEVLTQEKLYSSSNLYEAMQSQAPVSQYSAILKVTALEMTRICNDIRLLASGPLTGLAELILPAVQPGSSMMPGKVNPSVLEMCNQAWFSVLGGDQTVSYAVQAGQLELNVMMPIIIVTLLESTRIATRSTVTLKNLCIDGIEPRIPRLKHYFEATPQIATALSPKLGYAATAALVQEAEKNQTTVLELVRRKKLLSKEEIESLLDIDGLTGRTRRSR